MPCVAGSRTNRTTRLSGRRSQTRRAERICANLGVSRLARSAATRCDGPLDLVTNPPRQNGPDSSPDALSGEHTAKAEATVADVNLDFCPAFAGSCPSAPRL